jgi:hypothetical protein
MKNALITFLNFCVDIGRGDIDSTYPIHRSFELYERGMYDNINTHIPLICYNSIKNLKLPSHRNDNNFKSHYFGIEEIEKEFPNFNTYKEMYDKTSKDDIEQKLFYYNPLVVLKMKKMMDVIETNIFNSDYFFWIDCHFTSGILDQSFLNNESDYLKMHENVKNKNGDKFLLFKHESRPYGFFWGGSKLAIQNVYKTYFDIYFDSLPHKLLTEELIFKQILENNPDVFNCIDISSYRGQYKIAVSEYLTK